MNSILKVFIFVTSVFSAPTDLLGNSVGTKATNPSSNSGTPTIFNFVQRIQEIDDS